MMHTCDELSVVIALPVYNDWDAAELVLAALDTELAKQDQTVAHVIFIDDGSVIPSKAAFCDGPMKTVRSTHVLRLRRNLGHQRAIAIGLAFIDACIDTDAVVVMDADGEDKPEDVPVLLKTFSNCDSQNIVFAARRKRFESRAFRFGYWLYRIVHRALTGARVEVGNFSVLSKRHLNGLVLSSDLWSHYAAAVMKARLPYVSVPADRGRRLCGRSRMSYVSLVTHGLSAISVFREVVGTRLLIAATAVAFIACLLLSVVVGIRVATPLAIPGWATTAAGILVILLFQLLTFSFALVFGVLGDRSNLGFLPMRDYKCYIDSFSTLNGRDCIRIRGN
jgi:hypothetical protein